MPCLKFKNRLPRRAGSLAAGMLLLYFTSACVRHAKPRVAAPMPANRRDARVVVAPRGETVTLPLPLAARYKTGEKVLVEIGRPDGPGTLHVRACRLLVMRRVWRAVSGPAVAQLRGRPTMKADAGSVLLPVHTTASPGMLMAVVTSRGALYLRMHLSALLKPGPYTFPIVAGPTAGGARPGFSGAGLQHVQLRVHATRQLLPLEQPVNVVALCSVRDLEKIYPALQRVQLQYLDRGNPREAWAVALVDRLVRDAAAENVSLFVRNIQPVISVTDVGRLRISWNAYDRTMGPYMSGAAFKTHVPLPVWFAPSPPRRIRGEPRELRQFWRACLRHWKQKRWMGQPILSAPALMGRFVSHRALAEVRQMFQTFRMRHVLVATAPGVRTGFGRAWVVQSFDRAVPPAGALASRQTLRAWPWMCVARHVRAVVWPHALARQWPVAARGGYYPLLVPTALLHLPGAPAPGCQPTARLLALQQGVQGVRTFALLQERASGPLPREVLAAMTGQTGMDPAASGRRAALHVPRGYLYAGWPQRASTWRKLPAVLNMLIKAATPGAQEQPARASRVYLAARMWLAQAHRPVGRIASYGFALLPGRAGPRLRFTMHLAVENPMGVATAVAARFPRLPGDFKPIGSRGFALPANGSARPALALEGHLAAVRSSTILLHAQLWEQRAGAELRLPAPLPVFVVPEARGDVRLSARVSGWPTSASARAFGPMMVNQAYMSRPALLHPQRLRVAGGARAWWQYDKKYLYMMFECRQKRLRIDRTSRWPLRDGRWWGPDGIQVEISGGARLLPGTPVWRIAVKPSGVVLVNRALVPRGSGRLRWRPAAAGVRYAVARTRAGYNVELAIPRNLFRHGSARSEGLPVWRTNVLRFDSNRLQSTSWSGPLVADSDLRLMGLLVGQPAH